MADVEQRAEAEASAKGLEGGARRAYVGGVFNRIRQAHARATAPGKGARMLKRSARKEARQEAKNRNERRKQLAAQERLRLRARTRREEPRGKAGDGEFSQLNPLQNNLKPIRTNTGDPQEINLAKKADPYLVHQVYGDQQLRTALRMYPNMSLREMADVIEERTGKKIKRGSRADMIRGIEAEVKPAAQPAPTPARPAATQQAPAHERYVMKVNGVDLSRYVADIDTYERHISEAKSGAMGAPASEVPGIISRMTEGRNRAIARYEEAAREAATGQAVGRGDDDGE